MRSLLKVNCLSGSCFPSAPPYCCQSVSALKSKHSDKEEGTKKKLLSFYVLRCAVCFFFPAYCPSAFSGLWAIDWISPLWAFTKAARLSPQGETVDRVGVSGEDRCSPLRTQIRCSNLRPRRPTLADKEHSGLKLHDCPFKMSKKIIKREHRRKDFCRLEEE